MKTILRGCLLLSFLLLIKIEAQAQVNVDETNLVTRLSGVNSLSVADAQKYLTGRNYVLSSKHTVPQATYSMDLYKYKSAGQTSSYLLTVISDQIVGSGYITYNEDEYLQAVKAIKEMGFVPGQTMTAESGKTLFTKGTISFLVQQKTAAAGVFYVMMLSDLVKTAQLSGIKK